ncbi:MAG: rRNA maturation RNase YbeY [Terracidiphilus sp.]|nr:rRNA maturation RNase YbeY [Terracidiphilus sp.]MDR3777062.1 rRNA maturation RNase YbeY [Terracidiphilus sp.]
MILLDPDLDPDLAPAATSAKTSAASAIPRNLRLPTVRTLAHFLALAQAAVRLKGQVTVLLTTDPAIRRLNRQFRGKNKATDVLSFPAEAAFPGMAPAAQIAGDLAISVPTALRQATEQGHPLSTEVKVLILHGLLHLAGYDHEIDNGKMARRELVLRARLGLPKGLIERATAPSPTPIAKKPGAPSMRRTSAAWVGKQKSNTAQPPTNSSSPKAARP